MITCQHAHQLFDRYLDGELSASLQTELHAHRLSCTACQNELALLEACGDVITMDWCEPQVSQSFTDRVVLAQRGRRAVHPRRWGRMLWLIGSPMAAAASIAFTLFVITPQRTQPTAVAGMKVAVSDDVKKVMLDATGKKLSPAAEHALAQTPQMPMEAGSFVDWFLAPIVERSKTTVEGTLGIAEELQWLMRRGLSGPNETLYARWQAMQQGASSTTELGRDASGCDPLDPSYLISPPLDQESNPPDRDRQSEPL